ncbi:MAG: hypothetical protein WC956_06260 [bacterium]
MPIDKINASVLGLPPAWISRAISGGGAMSNTDEIRKLLGEPIPRVVDQSTLRPEVAAFFAAGGLLDRLRKKLSLFSRKKGGKILPAKGTIASVDEEDNLYVGVDFLEQFGSDEALVAGIVAHEWGHMMSDLPRGTDWSHLTWEQLYALRRDEEADADGFAGRAMFLMNYSVEPMVEFLEKLDSEKKKKETGPDKLACHKYHNLATRAAILRESYEAEKRALETARRLFFQSGNADRPKIGRVIGAG